MAKKSVAKKAKLLTSKTTAGYGGRKASAGKFSVVLARPSAASAVGRKAQRVFVAGVERALGEAKTRKIAVTVQRSDGRLVRGVPARRGGTFVIPEDLASSTRDERGATRERPLGKRTRAH